jgi:hypothetical protein
MEWRQELGIHALVLPPQAVVRDRRPMLSKEVLSKSSLAERRADIAVQGRILREGKIGIPRPQR